MIALVEGAERRKTPNEIALNILLAGLTLIFLIVIVSLRPFALLRGHRDLADHADRAARRADPHHDRRAAVARSASRAWTGSCAATCSRSPGAPSRPPATSTCCCSTRPARSRSATARPPSSSRCPASSESELAEAAQLASLADETPEGRSIVVLAKQYGIRERDARPRTRRTSCPFTAADAHERRRLRRHAPAQGRRRRVIALRRRARAATRRPSCRPSSTASAARAARRWRSRATTRCSASST